MARRFFIQIIIVAAIAMLLSSLYYKSICNNLRETKKGIPGKLNQILYDSDKYDAVFVGSSRVLRNIDPILFDSITGMHSYNAGIDGANLTLIMAMTKNFIDCHKGTKFVFINLDTYTMEQDSSIFYYPQLFPHMDDPDMEALAVIEPKLLLGRKFPFLAISYVDDNLKGAAFQNLYDKCPACDPIFNSRGFAPIGSFEYHGKPDSEEPMRFVCDGMGFKKLDSLCGYCTGQHCKVYFIMAPMYNFNSGNGSNAAAYYTLLQKIELKYSIRELNFYNDKRFTKGFFYNNTHMNINGAEMYSHILADSFLHQQ
jgi:hypothetical protein